MGRQPWVVFGVMKTSDAVSGTVGVGFVATTLIGFTLIYGVLSVIDVYLLGKFARSAPPTLEPRRTAPSRRLVYWGGTVNEGYLNLETLWFVLIAVLWTGYFFLEGFDFGVGVLLPFLGRDDLDRRLMVNAIGPVWDGNEVWLLVAGGATFAAFPEWYATMFSGFYLALF
jgi:hypothetical protein